MPSTVSRFITDPSGIIQDVFDIVQDRFNFEDVATPGFSKTAFNFALQSPKVPLYEKLLKSPLGLTDHGMQNMFTLETVDASTLAVESTHHFFYVRSFRMTVGTLRVMLDAWDIAGQKFAESIIWRNYLELRPHLTSERDVWLRYIGKGGKDETAWTRQVEDMKWRKSGGERACGLIWTPISPQQATWRLLLWPIGRWEDLQLHAKQNIKFFSRSPRSDLSLTSDSLTVQLNQHFGSMGEFAKAHKQTTLGSLSWNKKVVDMMIEQATPPLKFGYPAVLSPFGHKPDRRRIQTISGFLFWPLLHWASCTGIIMEDAGMGRDWRKEQQFAMAQHLVPYYDLFLWPKKERFEQCRGFTAQYLDLVKPVVVVTYGHLIKGSEVDTRAVCLLSEPRCDAIWLTVVSGWRKIKRIYRQVGSSVVYGVVDRLFYANRLHPDHGRLYWGHKLRVRPCADHRTPRYDKSCWEALYVHLKVRDNGSSTCESGSSTLFQHSYGVVENGDVVVFKSDLSSIKPDSLRSHHSSINTFAKSPTSTQCFRFSTSSSFSPQLSPSHSPHPTPTPTRRRMPLFWVPVTYVLEYEDLAGLGDYVDGLDQYAYSSDYYPYQCFDVHPD
ncbi:hypothetical protein G7K_5082-t1 [Saitoella complicata NRRL Y-17804]|uniref:Uncharacterized protein n=1 Tax=Saitoella complicata (strain BCRC 22490 / CBS 7301 / JCM 7358 / NBRC 10748 / NRRL Y-17804) TaxID=698492 RepID=A0A0E9NMR4_SAICN|nr:hypothetical protein G7K_5082-t1 [Saitoella complicata NRRL Y-17804]